MALRIEYQRLSWCRIASLDAESDDYVLMSLDSVDHTAMVTLNDSLYLYEDKATNSTSRIIKVSKTARQYCRPIPTPIEQSFHFYRSLLLQQCEFQG